MSRATREPRDTLASRFDFANMRITGLGTFNYRATLTPPIYRIHPGGDGVVIADWVPDLPEVVTVRHFDRHGRLTRESAIGAELRPIAPQVKRDFIEEGLRMAEGPYESARRRGEPVPRNLRAAVEEGLLLPDYYAPIQRMLLTRVGDLWLRETTAADVHEGQWVVLGPDGEAKLRVAAPDGVVFKAIDGDRIWATSTNELDVPFIVLYELVPPGTCG